MQVMLMWYKLMAIFMFGVAHRGRAGASLLAILAHVGSKAYKDLLALSAHKAYKGFKALKAYPAHKVLSVLALQGPKVYKGFKALLELKAGSAV